MSQDASIAKMEKALSRLFRNASNNTLSALQRWREMSKMLKM